MKIRSGLAVVLAVAAFAAAADDREAYNRRAAETDMAAFRSLDVNRDGVLTRDEARGAVHFAPRFDDIDTNRDGVITLEEMRRYIERTYGVRPAA